MTLDEAIAHADEAGEGCDQCAAEHRQLAIWLRELAAYRQFPEASRLMSEKPMTSVKDNKEIHFDVV